MKKWILVGCIILVAIFTRFYQLGTNPPSMDWDEAAWGYNAYSIGIDGKDEFGRFLPHDYLESFGDFKPPMYAYLDVVPIKLLGLNPLSVRFPSAFFGVLTVLITYFLTLRIFYNSKNKNSYAFMSTVILAISPWHIMLSRAAFEANVATFFIVSGVWLFLGGVQNKKWYLIISAISFSLSIYTFNTSRIVSPLIVIFLSILFFKRLWAIKKEAILAAIVGLLFLLPTVQFLLSKQAGLRFQEVNIFSDLSVIKTINQEVANDQNAWWSKIIHNRRLAFGVLYIQHYLDHFNPSFLFISGDVNPKFSTQDVGQLYLWDLPFLIVGAFLIFRNKESYWWLIPLWLLLGIIPAATARETPHALRTETTLPTFQIIIAYGFWQSTIFLKEKLRWDFLNKSLAPTFIFLLFLNFLYFYHGLFTYYPFKYSGDWEYGYEQSISYVNGVQNKYSEIHITQAMGRPYVYYMFYLKENPNIFRKEAVIQRDAFGFVNIARVGKYFFDKSMSVKKGKILYLAVTSEVPDGAKVKKNFYALNGDKILVAYTL